MVVVLVLAALTLGGSVFYALAVVAGLRFSRRERPASNGTNPKISVLKPLAGPEPELEENLRSFFMLDYPSYELLFAVREPDDPAADAARRLIEAFPQIQAELIVTGEPPAVEQYPNAKVYSLIRMAASASGEILVISDSDIRAASGDLREIAAGFAEPSVGVLTCPYRAVAGASLWSQLEAVGMNTEFWGGALVAEMLSEMDFAIGPTMALRREYLDAVGGFEAVRDYLAEDFVLGNWAAGKGWKAAMSTCVVEHRIGSQSFVANLKHRLRWYRSTRRSRPAGYIAQVFTYPLPFAAMLAIFAGGAGWALAMFAACLCLRIAAAAVVSEKALRSAGGVKSWLLLPLQDGLSFLTWIGAFFGGRIVWRGREFELTRDGRLRPKAE